MNQNSEEKSAQRSQRRAFFGQLITAVGGGFLGGSILQKFLGSHMREGENNSPVSISINPLAVPRSKEGSKSNVE